MILKRILSAIACVCLGLGTLQVTAQQPSTQTAPISAVNAKYVNGVAPGYAPTAGSGLTLNLGGGTSFCSGTVTQYAAGTLSLTASTTNYIYLNTAASCVPANKTTTFSSGDVPIAVVVTTGSAISSITDVRSGFVNSAPSAGSTNYIQTAPSGEAAQAVQGPLNATVLSAANLAGYLTVDGTTYTTLNQVWTAAAALCTGGAIYNPTILLPSGVFPITAPLVEPATANCGVNLIGVPGVSNSPHGTVILATAIMTEMLLQTGPNSEIVLQGVSFVGGQYYTYPVSNWEVYATYCMDLQSGQFLITNVQANNCGTSAGGEAVRIGSVGGGGTVINNLAVNYDDGLYSVPKGTTAGPFTPPAYGIEMGSGMTDSVFMNGAVRDASYASFLIDAGVSDLKTYGLHGFGAAVQYPASSGIFPYAEQYTIDDKGGAGNVHTNPILDSFSKAGIYMEGTYNTVINPFYEVIVNSTGYTIPPASLVRFGINAKNENFIGGNCQGYNTTGAPLSQEVLYDSGASVNSVLLGSSYTSAAGCGLYTYQYQNGGGNAGGVNYTASSSSGGVQAYGFYVREPAPPSVGACDFRALTNTATPTFCMTQFGDMKTATDQAVALISARVGTIAAPTLATVGTPGSTSYSYECVGVVNGASSLGTPATITTGSAVLSSTNYNTIACPYTTTAYVQTYSVYRTAGGATQGLLFSNLEPQSLVSDTGVTATGSVPSYDATGLISGPSIINTTGATAITSATGTSPTTATCSGTCTIAHGSIQIVASTFTTGTFLTLVWPTTNVAWTCTGFQNGGTAVHVLNHTTATATGVTFGAGTSISGDTFYVDYNCTQ